MMRHRTPPILLAAVGFLAIARGGGCSSSDSGTPAGLDAGTADVVVVDAPADQNVAPQRDAAQIDPLEGWEPYADYDPSCEFYVPKSRDHMPGSIRWETCRATPATTTTTCRQMVLDWPLRIALGEWISPATRAVRRTDGHFSLITVDELAELRRSEHAGWAA